MTQPEEPESSLPRRQPTRELLLAQALDACITAERQVPGSANVIIAQQPNWARAELRRLVGLAGSLDAAATNALMSDEFRADARGRLVRRVASQGGFVLPGELSSASGAWTGSPASANGHHRPASRKPGWVWRAAAGGLFAVALGATATLTAAASALPGEPLYPLKQAQEELGVRLAADDQDRALALLRQADARLDETARLLQQGRTSDVARTTQRFDQIVQRATTTYVVAIDDMAGPSTASASMEDRLTQQQRVLQSLLQTAPEPARSDLREALVVTERGRALVADPQPVERALGRTPSSRPTLTAPLPELAAESVPTVTPKRDEPATPRPLIIADRHESAIPLVADSSESERGSGNPSVRTTGLARIERSAQPTVAARVERSEDERAEKADENPQPERASHIVAQPPARVMAVEAPSARGGGEAARTEGAEHHEKETPENAPAAIKPHTPSTMTGPIVRRTESEASTKPETAQVTGREDQPPSKPESAQVTRHEDPPSKPETAQVTRREDQPPSKPESAQLTRREDQPTPKPETPQTARRENEPPGKPEASHTANRESNDGRSKPESSPNTKGGGD